VGDGIMKKERTLKSIIWGCLILIIGELLINVIAYFYFHKDPEIDIILIRVAWFIIVSIFLAIPIIRKRKRNNVDGGTN